MGLGADMMLVSVGVVVAVCMRFVVDRDRGGLLDLDGLEECLDELYSLFC